MLKRKDKQNKPDAGPSKESAPKKPANKYQKLIKRVAVEGGIVIVVVGALAGLVMLAGNMSDSAVGKERKLRSDVQTVRTQSKKLETKIQDLGVASEIYSNLAEQRQNMSFVIERDNVRAILGGLRDKYNLTTLNIQFSPPEELKLKELELVKGKALRINLSVNVGGLSDHFLYSFIDDLTEAFPGIVQLKDVQLTRRQRITIDVLSQVSRGNAIETVSGTLNFAWYGYEETLEEEDVAEESAQEAG